MTDQIRVCVYRENDAIQLTLELPCGAGFSVIMLPAELDRFLDIGASVLVGAAKHAHMTFNAIQRESEQVWQLHELN